MKFSVACLFLFAGYASAKSPTVSVTLKDGSYSSIESAASPTLSFEGGNDDFEYGASIDVASEGLPRSFWGQKTSSSGGWNLKTRAELTQGKYDFKGEDTGLYISLEGNDDEEDTYIWGSGVVAKGDVQALKIGAKKIIENDGGKFMIAPRYKVEENAAEVVLGYQKDDTKAYLTLSDGDKNVLIKQKIDDGNSASFKAGASGFIAATLTNDSDLGKTTVTVTPDDIDVEIDNDGWVAGITTARSGACEPTVRFSKSLTFGFD